MAPQSSVSYNDSSALNDFSTKLILYLSDRLKRAMPNVGVSVDLTKAIVILDSTDGIDELSWDDFKYYSKLGYTQISLVDISIECDGKTITDDHNFKQAILGLLRKESVKVNTLAEDAALSAGKSQYIGIFPVLKIIDDIANAFDNSTLGKKKKVKHAVFAFADVELRKVTDSQFGEVAKKPQSEER